MTPTDIPPEEGQIVWVEFDPVRGSAQAGRRPALVLSPRGYHERSGRCVVCPITSRLNEWPFNVPLPNGLKTKGMVLVDQIRAIHRTDRVFGIIETAPKAVMLEVRGKLAALVGIDFALGGAEQ